MHKPPKTAETAAAGASCAPVAAPHAPTIDERIMVPAPRSHGMSERYFQPKCGARQGTRTAAGWRPGERIAITAPHEVVDGSGIQPYSSRKGPLKPTEIPGRCCPGATGVRPELPLC